MENEAYLLNIKNIDDTTFNRCIQFIDKRRKEKINSYTNKLIKYQSIGVGILLNYCLKKNELDLNNIHYDSYGKPTVHSNKTIYISLSHSGNYCACAISKSPVGIDVQEWIGANSLIIEKYFSNDEKKYLASIQNPNAFYSLWCRKECVIKALGKSNLQNTFVISCPENYIFYDFTYDNHSLAIFGEIENCPSKVQLITIEEIMKELL